MLITIHKSPVVFNPLFVDVLKETNDVYREAKKLGMTIMSIVIAKDGSEIVVKGGRNPPEALTKKFVRLTRWFISTGDSK